MKSEAMTHDKKVKVTRYSYRSAEVLGSIGVDEQEMVDIIPEPVVSVLESLLASVVGNVRDNHTVYKVTTETWVNGVCSETSLALAFHDGRLTVGKIAKEIK